MAADSERASNKPPGFDLSIQTENIAFDPAEMIACAACGRMNPPNRLKCLYCALSLEINSEYAASIIPALRKLELWENGYNLIVVDEAPDAPISRIAQLLSADTVEISAIFNAGTPLPLVRVETETQADLLKSRLESIDVRCSIVSDVDLAPDKPPVRLRGIQLEDEGVSFQDFNTGCVIPISSGDVALIILGIITSERVDSLEKKRRGGKTKLIDEIATVSDESVLDIYTRDGPLGYRVHLTGFDFSCLGPEKGLIAGENMLRLAVLLKQATKAKLVDNYAAVRQALGCVWTIESRRDPQGLKRAGFGRVEFGSVALSSNLDQFTRYSRLRWHLL